MNALSPPTQTFLHLDDVIFKKDTWRHFPGVLAPQHTPDTAMVVQLSTAYATMFPRLTWVPWQLLIFSLLFVVFDISINLILDF